MLNDKEFEEMAERLGLSEDELIEKLIAEGWRLGWGNGGNQFWRG